ncbi:MAG: opioid growth factor receptor-related protein [Actinomycetota bacterium]
MSNFNQFGELSNNEILVFYLGQKPNSEGRKIEEIWSWNYQELEGVHNYIQWLFPLREASRFNRDAPILTDATIAVFSSNDNLKARLVQSLKVMLKYYGLQCNDLSRNLIEVTRSEEYPQRKMAWINPRNHNYLRITRILTSLTILGLPDYAQALFKCLDEIYQEEEAKIGRETYRYWKAALKNH